MADSGLQSPNSEGKQGSVKRVLFRAAAALVAFSYIAVAGMQWAGESAVGTSSPPAIEHGLRWSPGNDRLWGEWGRIQSAQDDLQKPGAIVALRQAARLNPLEPDNWGALSSAYLTSGDTTNAGAALQAALLAVPHSPNTAWRFANFLVMQGRVREATPYLRVVAADARPMRLAAYMLAWKLLGDTDAVFRDVVPSDPVSRSDYLDFLCSRNQMAEAYPVWESLRGDNQLAVDRGNVYVARLAAAGLGAQAARVWNELLQDTHRAETKPAGETITNGDFENNVINAGLGWHLVPGAGYDIAFDNFELFKGSRSLRVAFDGNQNPNFAGVWQLAAVDPGARYHFTAYIKTANITTTNGLSFCLSAYGQGADTSMNRCTPEVTGTENWKAEELEFAVPEKTSVVIVALRRLQSTKLNNRLAGKVWIDDVSLRKQD